jgi:hypothetical protein
MGPAPVGCMDRRQRQAVGNGARQAAHEPTHAPCGRMDTRGSDAWFTLAILMNPVILIALARTIGGQPVGPRPVRSAAADYSPVFAAVFSAIGFAPRVTRSARHTAGLDTGCWTGSSAEGGDHRPGTSGGQMPTDTGTKRRDRGSLRANQSATVEPGRLLCLLQCRRCGHRSQTSAPGVTQPRDTHPPPSLRSARGRLEARWRSANWADLRPGRRLVLSRREAVAARRCFRVRTGRVPRPSLEPRGRGPCSWRFAFRAIADRESCFRLRRGIRVSCGTRLRWPT